MLPRINLSESLTLSIKKFLYAMGIKKDKISYYSEKSLEMPFDIRNSFNYRHIINIFKKK